MKKTRADSTRALALEVCSQVLIHHRSLTEPLKQAQNQLEASRDRAFVGQLCFEFCRYYHLLDGQLQNLLSKGLKQKDTDIRIILILGLLQLRFMRVSDHAAVDESVKLLRVVGKSWAKGLVNAVLRNFIRQGGSGESGSNLSDPEHQKAYPAWMVDKIQADWPGQARQIMAQGNALPAMTLRIDLRQTDRDSLIDEYQRAGIALTAHPLVDSAVVLSQSMDVMELPGFDRGLVSVQDASAQLAAGILDCQPGMRVLDACAAPGGKSLHLLQHTPGIDLVALDQDSQRLDRIRQNLDRASVDARILCADAADSASWWDGEPFDRILLDVPCSASGIISRHPDIRLLRQASDVDSLVIQQTNLLRAMWPLLKPGGRLVYSTCSIFKRENEEQVAGFIESVDNGREVSLKTVQWGTQRPVGRQILPGNQLMDGFYYACLSRS